MTGFFIDGLRHQLLFSVKSIHNKQARRPTRMDGRSQLRGALSI